MTLTETLLLIPVIAIVGIILGILFKGIDRILAARMQARVGPPLIQPWLDVKKLLMKENIVPKNAVKWLFNLMPIAALAASITLLFYIPLFGFPALLEGQGDLILVLYLLTIPSLALVLGGFASGSVYAAIGAQREMVTMLGYEFPLAIIVVGIAWLLSNINPVWKAFSLAVISANPVWGLVGPVGFLGLAILFIVLLAVMPAELSKIPFDSAEAETEISGGVLAEYSGRNLALFYLADAVKTIAMSALVVAIFLPWNISALVQIDASAAILANALFFILKLFIVMFVGSTFVRVSIPRLRITQIVKVYWGYATMAAAFGLLLIAVDFLAVIP